jgi:hypothetical protein
MQLMKIGCYVELGIFGVSDGAWYIMSLTRCLFPSLYRAVHVQCHCQLGLWLSRCG